MALIKRKGRKNWYAVIYVNGKHKWISTGTDNKEDAELFELDLKRTIKRASIKKRVKNFLNQAVEDIVNDVTSIGTPVNQLWNLYIKQPGETNLKASTLHTKKSLIRKFEKWLKEEGVKHIEDVDEDCAMRYAQKLNSSGVANQTFNNHRNTLHGAFQALRYPLNINNPFSVVKPIKAKHNTLRPFTDSEIVAILKEASPDWKTLILLGLYTGLRQGDCAALTWDCIQDGIIVTVPGKTERYNRTVAIPIHAKLQEHLDSLARDGKAIVVMNKRERYKGFSEILKKAKIEDNRITFHSLRHTFNDKLHEAGVHESVRMMLTGHSNLQTNLIYTHAIEPLKNAIDKLK